MKFPSPSLFGLLSTTSMLVGLVAAREEEEMEIKFAYLAYFSDPNCTRLGGIKPIFPNDYATEFTKARTDVDGNDISCHDGMACVYSPDGPTCAARVGMYPEVLYLNYTLDGDGNLFRCDPSNVAEGQPECGNLDYSACIASSVYNCHLQPFTQDAMESLFARERQRGQGTMDEVPAGTSSAARSWSLSPKSAGSVLGAILVFGIL
jgi:hypothetical protein